jgi:hypothetical protein
MQDESTVTLPSPHPAGQATGVNGNYRGVCVQQAFPVTAVWQQAMIGCRHSSIPRLCHIKKPSGAKREHLKARSRNCRELFIS